MDEVRVEREGSVGIIVLAAPERKNVLTGQMSRRICEACSELESDASIGAIVIRAEGEAFCGGADKAVIEEAAKAPLDEGARAAIEAIYDAFLSIGRSSVPTLAAVRGQAFGGGFNLALAADIRIVAEDALLMSGFGRAGLHPGGGHFHLLGRCGSQATAAAIALFGRPVSGKRAAQLGLAWEAVPSADVDKKAIEIAQSAAKNPVQTRAFVKSFRSTFGPPALPWDEALTIEAFAQTISLHQMSQARGNRDV